MLTFSKIKLEPWNSPGPANCKVCNCNLLYLLLKNGNAIKAAEFVPMSENPYYAEAFKLCKKALKADKTKDQEKMAKVMRKYLEDDMTIEFFFKWFYQCNMTLKEFIWCNKNS